MLKKQYKVFESEALSPSEKAQIVKIEAKEFVYSYKNIEKVAANSSSELFNCENIIFNDKTIKYKSEINPELKEIIN